MNVLHACRARIDSPDRFLTSKNDVCRERERGGKKKHNKLGLRHTVGIRIPFHAITGDDEGLVRFSDDPKTFSLEYSNEK